MKGWFAIALWVLSLGCDKEAPPEIQTAYERDLSHKLFACTGCQQKDSPDGELDLTDPWTLVDVPSRQVDMKLIEPGNHLRSYLWHKVNGSQSIAGGLGRRMPVSHTWTPEEIELLGQWIDLGMPR